MASFFIRQLYLQNNTFGVQTDFTESAAQTIQLPDPFHGQANPSG